jgi:ribosome-interacting GTPase 1
VPANLTPAYRAAEERYREARTYEEKLAALEEMLAVIPKHKGTEKMQGDLRRRISRLKDQISQQGRKSGARHKASYSVRREGAGQVALVGPANSGKSSLLAAVSNADVEIGEYPFTTQTPQPGMVRWENVQVQVVDLPPFDPELSPPWLSGSVRSADALTVVLSLASDDILQEAEETFALLQRHHIWLTPGRPPVPDLDPTAWGGESLPGPAPPREEGVPGPRRWPGLIVASKLDASGATDRLGLLAEACPALPILAVSAKEGWGLDDLRAWFFGLLDKIRVYTKAPGKKADMSAPFVIPRGSTVLEAAAAVHKDFARHLKLAKVWGRRTFEGQAVSRDYVLEDGDIIELRM